MISRNRYLLLILWLAVGLIASACGSGGTSSQNSQKMTVNPNPVIPPSDPNAGLLNSGKLVKGTVKENCDNSVVLDEINALCELFKIAKGDGSDACITQTSHCSDYGRQIYTGSVLGPGPKIATWNARGGSGALMADAAVCSLRELSPKVPGGGPILSEASLNIGIGDVKVRQEVGYLDFDRIYGRFKGYRNLRVELPVIGKFNAVTQDIDVGRVFYPTGQLFKEIPEAGGYPLLFAYGLNVYTQEKDKSINIDPGSFNVTTPIGVFQVSPHFEYASNAVVDDAPFVTDHTYVILPNDQWDNTPAAIRLSDIYGVIQGIYNNSTPLPNESNYKSLRTGWVSQLGLGTRGSIGDKMWAPPASGFFSRPDYDPSGVLKFEFYDARSEEEKRPSVYAEASASIKYPENPSEMLPGWIDGLPGLKWDAYIKVTPTVKAGAAGQFGLSLSEGTDNQRDPKEFGAHAESRTSALGIYSGVEVNASFEVLAELRLYVSADFGWPIDRIDLIDINPKFPIPLAGGNPASSKVELAAAYSSSDNTVVLPETLDYLKTFKGVKKPEEFINLCYAKEAQVQPEEPPKSEPEKGDASELFEYLPCNICLATDEVINPKTGAVKEPAHRDIISPVNPTPPAVWQCDAASKSGCMDLCKLNKETGEFTVVKNPSQIADSIPSTDPDYNKLYPFYKSCMISCEGVSSPIDFGGITACKGLDSTPPSIFGIMVPGSSGDGAPAPVPVNTNLAAPFSEPMDPASINTNTFTVTDADGNAVDGDVSYDPATYRAIFIPLRSFDYDATYTATVRTGVRDAAGNALAADFSWNFATISAPAVAEERTAFVTSVQGNGNLSTWPDAGGKAGLEAGDAICQARASAAGLGGNFIAWLSDYYDDAYCRVHNLTGKKASNCGQGSLPVAAGPWVRTDGFPFSETIDQLVNDGEVFAPASYDEYGNPLGGNENYMTGTNADGTYDMSGSIYTCYDWTGISRITSAVGGRTDGTTYSWTHNYSGSCDSTSWRLLCLETGAGTPLPPYATAGKKVFVTSSSGTGNLGTWAGAGGNIGLAAGDAVCQSKAAEAGLANSSKFKAWLSSYISGTSVFVVHAKDRLTSNGPWVRPDGVKVADSKADLLDGSLFTAISQTETGAYLSTTAWTGTYTNGTLNSVTSTCEGWTTSAPPEDRNANLGDSSLSSSYWTGVGYSPCSAARHLYCFED